MSAPAGCFCRLVRLLAVLWAVGRGGASPSPPSATVSITADQLLRLVERAVTAETRPLVDRIERLAARLNTLDSRLLALDRLDSRLDELTARGVSTQDRLGSRLDQLVSRVEDLVGRQNAQDSGRRDGPSSRLDGVGAQLDGLSARLDAQETLLDEMASRGNSTRDGVDAGSSAAPTPAGDELSARRFAGQSCRDGLSARLDELSSRLDTTRSRLEEQLTSGTVGRPAPSDPCPRTPLPRDCSDLPAAARNGVHLLRPGVDGSGPPVAAFCDQQTAGGGWTVIQRRADIQPRQEFYLDWPAYREGFGELAGEFWWGLEHLRKMTGPRDRRYQLRVELADFDGGRRHAEYGQFRVASEDDGFRLSIANYSGDAGDSFSFHNGQRFTTRNRDQDVYGPENCAQKFRGAGWYRDCYRNNLNGEYLSGPTTNNNGVNWNAWRGDKYSLKDVEIKIRAVKT